MTYHVVCPANKLTSVIYRSTHWWPFGSGDTQKCNSGKYIIDVGEHRVRWQGGGFFLPLGGGTFSFEKTFSDSYFGLTISLQPSVDLTVAVKCG